MKHKTCFLSEAVKWCASKCRALLGAFGFMLPAVPATAPVRGRSFRRVALLLVFLFLLLAPTFVRPRKGDLTAVFACPVRIRSYCYATTFGPTDFTYTGTYTWVDDGAAGWRLKFLTSGTFTPSKSVLVDVFLSGGGGGGKSVTNSTGGGSGGGGGYTGTWLSVQINAGQAYAVTIGGGGATNSNGGSTSGFGHSVNGGYGASVVSGGGANGGSGGGAYANGSTAAGTGGSNGSNGGSVKSVSGGTGQGSTTYEFGDAGLTLYSGGGGGGGSSTSTGGGAGGAGGGANGGASGQNGSSASANTGGGGGGAGHIVNGTRTGGSGGAGICTIRNKR